MKFFDMGEKVLIEVVITELASRKRTFMRI